MWESKDMLILVKSKYVQLEHLQIQHYYILMMISFWPLFTKLGKTFDSDLKQYGLKCIWKLTGKVTLFVLFYRTAKITLYTFTWHSLYFTISFDRCNIIIRKHTQSLFLCHFIFQWDAKTVLCKSLQRRRTFTDGLFHLQAVQI